MLARKEIGPYLLYLERAERTEPNILIEKNSPCTWSICSKILCQFDFEMVDILGS